MNTSVGSWGDSVVGTGELVRVIQNEERSPSGARMEAATRSRGVALKRKTSAISGTAASPAMAPVWTISQILGNLDLPLTREDDGSGLPLNKSITFAVP